MKKLAAAFFALGLFTPAHGADLLTLYRQALAQDATYQAARAARDAGREKLPQARAGLLPSVNLQANTTWNDQETTYRSGPLPSGTSRFNSHGYGVSVAQPLYRRQNLAAVEQAKAVVESIDAQFSQAGQELALRVAQAYFDVLLAQDNVALARAQKEAIAEQLAQARRAFEVGTATITDTHEAQARYDLITAQEIAATNELEIKRRELERLTGTPVEAVDPLRGEPPLLSPEGGMETWVERALAHNPSVAAARAALEAANQQVEFARGGHHPTLDLVASYTDNRVGGGTFGAFDQTSKSIGLQLAIPLYQGGGTDSRVREALANQEKARQELEAAVRAVTQQVRQAYLGVTSGIAQVKALKQALASSELSLESTRLGVEVGVRTSVDLLNARQQLFSAKRDLAQATYGYILSRLRLEAAAGDLNEADLAQTNTWLAVR
jgi:outer membrane protein